MFAQGGIGQQFDVASSLQSAAGPASTLLGTPVGDLHKLRETYAETPEVLTWAQAVRQLHDEGQK